jgi:hypothetical protein
MPESFASQTDLEDSLGRALTSAEEPKAQAALRYASNLVRAQHPAVNLLTTVPDLVATAVVSLAERRFLASRDGATGARSATSRSSTGRRTQARSPRTSGYCSVRRSAGRGT